MNRKHKWVSPPSRRKLLLSWALYDWANSAFPTVITTFVFATYFVSQIARDTTLGTVQWGYTMAFSGLIIAVLSPILGTIADITGQYKRFLQLFTLICISSTALLWFAKPDIVFLPWSLVWVILATIGFEVGTVFYNAMLPTLISPSYYGRLSGWAWGIGYAGGLSCLIFCLVLFINKPPSWLDVKQAEHIRICAPFVALWFAVFSIPLLSYAPYKPAQTTDIRQALSMTLTTLRQTLADLRQTKSLTLFLIARMLYTDGMNTIFAFGGIYAAGSFHMSIKDILLFGIAMNISAGLGAASFAWLDDWIGPKRTIILALIGISGTATGILITHQLTWFWLLALTMSLFFGPAQAASRTLMAHLAPKSQRNEMFGLYALSGKITAYASPWLLSTVTLATHSQRLGLATVLLFLIAGFCLLLRVHVPIVQKS